MPEIKKFRLGGAAGYSLVAYGSKTRTGVVYERIELVDEDHPQYVRDVTVGDMPLFVGAPTEEDHAHLVALLTEARKHLAMCAA